jgi:hypothetical protein
MTGAAAAAATPSSPLAKMRNEIMSVPIENVLGSTHTETPTSRPPHSPAREATRSTTAVSERQSLQEHVGQPAAREGRPVSKPTRLQGQALNYREFIRAVQESGAVDSSRRGRGFRQGHVERARRMHLVAAGTEPRRLASEASAPAGQLSFLRELNEPLRLASLPRGGGGRGARQRGAGRSGYESRAAGSGRDAAPRLSQSNCIWSWRRPWAPLTHLLMTPRDRVSSGQEEACR